MKTTPYLIAAGIAVLAVAVAVVLIWGYFKASPKVGGGKVEWVDVNTLQRGPIQHDTLTPDQMARLEQIHRTFAEVDGFTLEKRVDDFRRDHDPDRELAVWERMARAYQRFVASRKDMSLETKKEVYRVVLLRSMASEEEVLARLKTSVLSRDDARAIMRDY